MPSFLLVTATLAAAYFSTFAYCFIRNYNNGRKTGVPLVPVAIDSNHLLWMLLGVPLKDWLQRNLPESVYKRVVLTIYGWEQREKFRPFDELAAPQGDRKSFLLVTAGRLEFWTWDAQMAAQILGRPRDFNQFDVGNIILNKFGDNILTTDGYLWARHRKVVAGVINERISKEVFRESVMQTKGLLNQLHPANESNGWTETNKLFDCAKKITIRVLSGAGMGAHVPWEDDNDQNPAPGYQQTYTQSVTHVISNLSGPILLPQWLLQNYPSWAPAYSILKPLGIAIEEFPIHTDNLLKEERRRAQTEGGSSKSNILSQLLEASDSSGSHTKSGGQSIPLTDRDLRGDLFIFTAAGFDTTANTISYALALLARHPHWQEWLLEEIDEILPQDPDQELDYSTTFPKATKTLAFMYEVLRLYTPLIHIAKQTKAPQRLQTSDRSYSLPTNTTVYINSVCLHRDREVWHGLNLIDDETCAEDDAMQFRPSRWINPPGSAQPLYTPAKGTYVPWSQGPRVCPGQKMAQVEFVAIFLTILRRHRIEAVALGSESGEDVERRLDQRFEKSISLLTLQMDGIYGVKTEEDGLKLRISMRK